MTSTAGYWLSILFSIAVSLALGSLAYRLVWIAIGLLGIIAGILLGVMASSIVMKAADFSNAWVMAGLALAFGLFGGWCTLKYSRDVVLIGTSLIGSYSFMRGISYFFGGYPNEAELLDDMIEEIPIDDMNDKFWVYLAIFLFGTISGIYYQYHHTVEHESLKNHKQYADSGDGFQRVKGQKVEKTN